MRAGRQQRRISKTGAEGVSEGPPPPCTTALLPQPSHEASFVPLHVELLGVTKAQKGGRTAAPEWLVAGQALLPVHYMLQKLACLRGGPAGPCSLEGLPCEKHAQSGEHHPQLETSLHARVAATPS